MGSSNGITGNYTCQKVGDESVSRSVYVYWEATSPPFLIQQGQNATAVLNPSTNVAVIPCTVARPDILVALFKYNTNTSVRQLFFHKFLLELLVWINFQSFMEFKKNDSIQYDSKKGFTLTNLPAPYGQYKCVANSDDKDTATVHVIPNTSPGIFHRFCVTIGRCKLLFIFQKQSPLNSMTWWRDLRDSVTTRKRRSSFAVPVALLLKWCTSTVTIPTLVKWGRTPSYT